MSGYFAADAGVLVRIVICNRSVFLLSFWICASLQRMFPVLMQEYLFLIFSMNFLCGFYGKLVTWILPPEWKGLRFGPSTWVGTDQAHADPWTLLAVSCSHFWLEISKNWCFSVLWASACQKPLLPLAENLSVALRRAVSGILLCLWRQCHLPRVRAACANGLFLEELMLGCLRELSFSSFQWVIRFVPSNLHVISWTLKTLISLYLVLWDACS